MFSILDGTWQACGEWREPYRLGGFEELTGRTGFSILKTSRNHFAILPIGKATSTASRP